MVFAAAVCRLEKGDDALAARDVLIERDGLLVVAAHGKKVIDILVVAQRGHHSQKHGYEKNKQTHAQTASALEKIIYFQKKRNHMFRS